MNLKLVKERRICLKELSFSLRFLSKILSLKKTNNETEGIHFCDYVFIFGFFEFV